MVSTYTTNAHIELQGTGDNSGTWGTVLNTTALTIIDNVFGAVQTVSLGAVDVTLTTTQSQSNAIFLTGTLTASVSVIFPSIGRTYFIRNATTGNFTVTIKTASAGVTTTIPQGSSGFFVMNVTDVYQPTLPSVPIGTIVIAATSSAIGTGWLYCNGQAVSRTTYAGLFAVISTVFGTGDGVTTFNVPDMRGVFPRGYDDGRGLDPARVYASLQTSANLAHTHSGTTANQNADHDHDLTLPSYHGLNGIAGRKGFSDGDSGGGSLTNTTSGVSAGHQHTFVTGSSGGSESRPVNIALDYMIKAF